MPYCHKCGTKLDDDAKFCPVCGTPVAQVNAAFVEQATRKPASRRTPRAAFPLAAIVLIVILVVAAVGVAIAFVPVLPVNFNQANEASAGNVDALKLFVTAETANVNVLLKDLPGSQRAAVNVSATGLRGIFGSDHPLALTFNEDTANSTLLYSVSITRPENRVGFDTLDVACDVYVDPSVSLDITVQTTTGSVTMNADEEATVTSLTFETITGSVSFSWDEAKTTGSIPVILKATTGSVTVDIKQTGQLAGNVALDAEVVTGSVNFVMNIQNGVGARISGSTVLGGVNVEQEGFSGNETLLQSINYPEGSNYDVNLRATTGSININASYQLGGTRT